jgi:2',3'-cyclic-nucleotide 3'-phosphodiesterase
MYAMSAKPCPSHDCPKVPQEDINQVESYVLETGVNLDGEGKLGGWVGGRVVLVPTDRPIKEWAPIAEKTL